MRYRVGPFRHRGRLNRRGRKLWKMLMRRYLHDLQRRFDEVERRAYEAYGTETLEELQMAAFR